jgi:hypothetical protein
VIGWEVGKLTKRERRGRGPEVKEYTKIVHSSFIWERNIAKSTLLASVD